MKKIIIAVSILAVVFFSCKDEDVITTPELTSMQATQDHLFAEKIFENIGKIVEKGFNDNGQKNECPSYSIINADTSDIDTLIINFNGDPVCFDPNDGMLRSGKIVITYTGKYRDSLSIITTTFDNYNINYNLVQGERIVTNQGRNSSGNMWFTIDVNNASISTNNGTINWESSRVREWMTGQETLSFSDDTYKITGSSSGNGVNGNTFTVQITNSLDVVLGCLPACVIRSGQTTISPNGYPNRVINYGDSICDCNVDVIINETTYPITIGD
jgi:hypothetical protein